MWLNRPVVRERRVHFLHENFLHENSDPFTDFELEEFVELDFQKIPTDGYFR